MRHHFVWYHCGNSPKKVLKMSDSDDDRPISELIKKRLNTRESSTGNNKASKKQKVGSEESDDDDKPISKLGKKESKLKHEEKAESTSKRTSSATQLQSEYYLETEKGKLVQRLLVRWWYAIEWPKKEDIGIAPSGYEPLEGFLGVYISTKVRVVFRLSYQCFNQSINLFC